MMSTRKRIVEAELPVAASPVRLFPASRRPGVPGLLCLDHLSLVARDELLQLLLEAGRRPVPEEAVEEAVGATRNVDDRARLRVLLAERDRDALSDGVGDAPEGGILRLRLVAQVQDAIERDDA